MILAIDIGNTNIVLGGCQGDEILFRDRIATNQSATALEYASLMKTAFEMNGVKPEHIQGAIISSVVPSVTGTLRTAVQRLAGVEPMVVGPGIKTGLSILIDNPAQLGSDLVVDAVAGLAEYPLPLIIVDMGTATTLSVLDGKGNYQGGMIVPGVAVMHDSLISRTAQLPKIALEPPKRVIGKNTVECLKSGILYGNAGILDGLIDRIQAEMGGGCTVVATGGLAGVIAPLCRNPIILDDNLLLKGLLRIYRKNEGR